MSKYDPERVQDVAFVLRTLEENHDGTFLPDHVQFEQKNNGSISLVYTQEDTS